MTTSITLHNVNAITAKVEYSPSGVEWLRLNIGDYTEIVIFPSYGVAAEDLGKGVGVASKAEVEEVARLLLDRFDAALDGRREQERAPDDSQFGPVHIYERVEGTWQCTRSDLVASTLAGAKHLVGVVNGWPVVTATEGRRSGQRPEFHVYIRREAENA